MRVEVTDRATGRAETLLADYVLGCDGANSITRAAIGATMRDLRFQQRWLVVDVATTADLDAWDGVHQVCDTDRAATYMRVGATRYRWEFRLKPDETADDFREITRLHPLIAPWTRDIPVEQLEIVRVAEYAFRAQVADRWRDRRIFLLGDAAHLTPPFIGQGMGAGVRDAANLSWKLAGVLQGRLPHSVLDTYEIERKPHVRALIRTAKLVGTAMTAGDGSATCSAASSPRTCTACPGSSNTSSTARHRACAAPPWWPARACAARPPAGSAPTPLSTTAASTTWSQAASRSSRR